jgi:hypothetical protein
MLLAVKKRGATYRRFKRFVHERFVSRLQLGHDPLELPVNRFKTSDTLYILASGSSINSLDAEAWVDIAKADSFGINFWLYHDFVPTWYSCEIPRTTPEADVMMQLMQIRLPSYQNTAFLLKDVLKMDQRYPAWPSTFPLNRIPHIYTLHTLGVPGRDPGSLRRWLRLSRWLGYFRPSLRLWGIPMKRATVFLSLAFGLMAGYRRLVLCGVDLNRPDYFYQDPKYVSSNLPQLPPLPAETSDLAALYNSSGVHLHSSPNPKIHNTMDPALNPMPMDEVIHAFHEEVLKPEGVELWTALPCSALYPRIPAYFRKTF